ncbi:ABC transporter ATP-binding protein [bacterium]|nr:ABC transporter ATP-binding protein [bacterium]
MKKKAVRIQDLSFSYPDKSAALDRISFSVSSGESLGIIGPNGAGKSTALLHLNGVLKGKGEVRILGEKVHKGNLKWVRSRVGIVFQDPNDQLFMPTVFDDVAFGLLNLGWEKEEVQNRVQRVLKNLGLEGVQDRNPSHLSFGEKKKISLATVLVLEPEILVLDEPTANLDPGSRRNFLEILEGIPKTKIMATHDLDSVWQLCSRVLLMNKGKVIAQGESREILEDEKLLEQNNLEVPHRLLLEKKE